MASDFSVTPDTMPEPRGTAANAWIDIFYGMLISPIQTLNVLSNPALYPPGLSAVLGSILIVVLCALANSATAGDCASINDLALNMIGSCLATLFFWLTLALFLRLLAAVMKIETSIRCCFIVTGWSFLPLVFKAMAACFSNATVFGGLLSLSLSLWFLFLELFAFDCVLKLGRFKTLGVILVLPPCLFFAYFISMIFVGVIMTDGFF